MSETKTSPKTGKEIMINKDSKVGNYFIIRRSHVESDYEKYSDMSGLRFESTSEALEWIYANGGPGYWYKILYMLDTHKMNIPTSRYEFTTRVQT